MVSAETPFENSTRDPPIMLTILPIMLCCTAQNLAYYAYINAQYLPIMLKIMLDIYTSVPIFFLVSLHFMGK